MLEKQGSVTDKDPSLRVYGRKPYNAGPPVTRLCAHNRTPNSLFFVRNHGDIPQVNRAQYRLHITGLVERELSLSLDELRDLPRTEVQASLQCAGNRRSELNNLHPTHGSVPWGGEAIGNASWGGYPLHELLKTAGPLPHAEHVEFEGLDVCEHAGERFHFGASIPLDKALTSEVLIVDTMNGTDLPVLHGAPLRLVVPGYIGARSVKWLSRIHLRETPSENHYQASDYRIPGPNTDLGPALTDQPINSLICSPTDDGTVDAGDVTISGWAYAGARSVARVDVTSDGGTSWTTARLGDEYGRWSWRFWETSIRLPRGRHEIAARAVDEAANSQPERIKTVWNAPGYVNNAWSRVTVEVS